VLTEPSQEKKEPSIKKIDLEKVEVQHTEKYVKTG